MISAYEYAAGGDRAPHEIKLYRMIQQYGSEAVLGRMLYAGEIYRMNAAMNVYNAKVAKDTVENWADWSHKNPHAAEILIAVEKLMAEHDG